MKPRLILLVCTLMLTIIATAQKPATADQIRELMEITGAGDLGVQMSAAMMDNFRSLFPDVPNEFWSGFREEMDADTLINLIIPVYEKYYTAQDVEDLITFYKSPLGAKVIESNPIIMKESMAIGEHWGRQIGEKVVKQLQAKGLMPE